MKYMIENNYYFLQFSVISIKLIIYLKSKNKKYDYNYLLNIEIYKF